RCQARSTHFVPLRGASRRNLMANADNGPESPVLRYLRNIDHKVDVLANRVEFLTTRVASVERTFAILVEQAMTLNQRMDGIDQRLDRIERQLELRDAPIEGSTHVREHSVTGSDG